MAKTTNSGKRVHVTPGVYTSETELQTSSKSLGITTLGIAGETTRGAAFQRVTISDWKEYNQYFGSTSTEKFRGSQYPKYELPYIAKEYLSKSQQLEVVRVLGLSGVNAGDAWLLTAYCDDDTKQYNKKNPLVIGVLRSRGEHVKAAFVEKASGDVCEDVYEYDGIEYYAKAIKIKPSTLATLNGICDPKFNIGTGDLNIDSTNLGRFTLEVETGTDTRNLSVSLNSEDNNYIVKVLGTDPEVGDTEIYVEELYDIALRQLVEEGELNTLGTEGYLPKFERTFVVPVHEPVNDLLIEDESMLTRRDVGKRFLYNEETAKYTANGEVKYLTVHISDNKGLTWHKVKGIEGHIYTVRPYTTADGTRKYYYTEYIQTGTISATVDTTGVYTYSDDMKSTTKNFETEVLGEPKVDEKTMICSEAVEVLSYGAYFIKPKDESIKVVSLDLNNYKEPYRYASTPWVLSEIKGSATHIEINKLFRFHTISDGESANTEVKISIENILPEEGTFDVVVRSFYDTDANPIVLERFKGCTLVPGSENYIAYKIGSFDDAYETKSKYVTVEVNETETTYTSIPAGFMGYPVRNWSGNVIKEPTGGENSVDPVDVDGFAAPYMRYNTNVDEDIRATKQYFGLSNITGIDEDILRYKGIEAYDDEPTGLTPCFHLDSRIVNGRPEKNGLHYESKYPGKTDVQIIAIDGREGYEWVTVGRGNVTMAGIEPRIGKEEEMRNTIYEDRRYRKFTMAFYGGWDGWDYYRTYRSNTDDFKYQKYRGHVNLTSGEGVSLSVIKNTEAFGFEAGEKILNSDYYAYLSAIKMFANPKVVDINVLATPGIDYVNNNLLVGEVIDMVEEERADTIYVVTTPDKPFGAGDSVAEMYTPAEVVDNLEDSDIDTNYVCTFYPWVKVLDNTENQYIFLPPTKDVVKAFAYTDNIAQPWFAASGMNRGTVNGIKPKRTLKLGEQDELYDNRINPITTFATEGMRIWGDKNLQKRESVMNRISKRRLMLRLRKLVSAACIGLIFDPNDPTMGQTLRSAIDNVMQEIRTKGGIVQYKIEIDDSQETRDRMELGCRILVKPVVNLEYITIEFAITMNGLLFED